MTWAAERAMTPQAGQPAQVLPAAMSLPPLLAPHPRLRRDDRHSRRVAVLKRVLPVIGIVLLALITIWPRLVPLLDSVRFGLALIDLREAHELKMVNPRYAGVDRYNRPYVVTSAVGRQASSRDDLMSLERPQAEMTMRNGARVVVTATRAMYQAQPQLLDLFDDVNLVHENGTRFVTNSAHVDVAANTAVGNDPVTGRGPSGDITAQGFRVVDQGNTVFFTGKSDLLLKGSRPNPVANSSPPSLPPQIQETAAALERAAIAGGRSAPEPGIAGDAPAHLAPVAAPRSGPDAGVRGFPKRDSKLPTERVRAGKVRPDAG
jgi:lipopolysaccharide export system protein LptC